MKYELDFIGRCTCAAAYAAEHALSENIIESCLGAHHAYYVAMAAGEWFTKLEERA